MLYRQIELQRSKKSETEDLDVTVQSLTSKQRHLEKEMQALKDKLVHQVYS